MLRPGIPIAVAAVALLLAAPAAGAVQEQPVAADGVAPPPAAAFSPDHVLVEWAARASRSDRVDAREDAGVRFGGDLGSRRFQLVEVGPGQTAVAAVQKLEDDPAVVAAERDGYSAPSAAPDDPFFDQLWGLQNLGTGVDGVGAALAGADIDALGAWERSLGDPATAIAVIDSGYRFEHPDLANVAWTNTDEIDGNSIDDDENGYVDDVRGYDFVGADAENPVEDNDPTDDDLLTGGHGVHTAGTLGAQGDNGVGITGVARDARIMPLRVCAHFASFGENRCPFSAQVAAINYAGENGARVANISLVATFDSAMVGAAIAANPQTLFVISAGNEAQDNDSSPHYPCSYDPVEEAQGPVDNVVCVAATDQADDLAGFSNWGATSVDLGAPGTEILSTYPKRKLIEESFELEDFDAKWEATGADGGFARTNEALQGSFAMSDSPGAAPVANSVKESTSAPVSLPAGFEACTLEQSRSVSLGGGVYRYDVLLDGSPVAAAFPETSGRFRFDLADGLAAGGEVSVRFRYSAGGAPGENDGVWLDDIDLTCVEPVGQAAGYEFLQGTSMAAPHVSGTAGLLFSLEPGATVTEVREVLLAGVDPVPALTGLTVTGGRLDAAAAIAALAPAPAPPMLEATNPLSPASDTQPRIIGTAAAGTVVDLYANASCAGSPIAGGSAAKLESPGIPVTVAANSTTQFSATATRGAAATSPCSAPIAYTNVIPPAGGGGGGGGGTVVVMPPPIEVPPDNETPNPFQPPPPVPGCTVPKLAGKALGQAKAALAGARCRLGKVTKPKPRRGKRLPALVVKFSRPATGMVAPGPVNLTLGPKPKPKRH